MALGNNMKKTYNCKDSLKLQKYSSDENNLYKNHTGPSNGKTDRSRHNNEFNTRIIEARMLLGTLTL